MLTVETALATTGSYEIEAKAYGAEDGKSTSRDSDIGFNDSCSDVEASEDITSGATTHTATLTLHACDFENNGGGFVTIALFDDDDDMITGDWLYIEVKPITVEAEVSRLSSRQWQGLQSVTVAYSVLARI